MAFNPNAQGVFLLGQLILDYTNVDHQANNGDNPSVRKQGNVEATSFDDNAFSGDGPARTLNPDAQEFYPTADSIGQFEVRVLNTPLTTHLQFPQNVHMQPTHYPSTAEIVELPYYGYPRPNGPPPNNNNGDVSNLRENNHGTPPSSVVPPLSVNFAPRPQNWIPTTTLLPNGIAQLPQMIGCQQVAYHHAPPVYNEHFMVRHCGPGVVLGPSPPNFPGNHVYSGDTENHQIHQSSDSGPAYSHTATTNEAGGPIQCTEDHNDDSSRIELDCRGPVIEDSDSNVSAEGQKGQTANVQDEDGQS